MLESSMLVRVHGVVTLILLLSAFHAHATPAARTPEALIEDLAAAAKQGDVSGFLSYLTADSRKAVDKSLESKASLQAAREALETALDKRFGKGEPVPTLPPKDFESVLRHISSFELLSRTAGQNGTMNLRVKTSLRIGELKSVVGEHTFVAREENGGWKLELNPDERINTTAEKIALNRVTAAVRNGQFRDRRSALLELNQIRLQESANPQIGERGAAFGSKGASRATRAPITSSSSNAVISVSPSTVTLPR
jgi:hypothetical protein